MACDGAPWDFFGYSVGTGWSSLPPYPVDRVVIGAPLDDVFDDDPSDDSGSAYVFRWYDNDTADDLDDDFWYHQAKLRASDDMPGSCFGYSVAMSGETAVVGAHAHSCMAPGAGAAYVFANPFKDCNGNGYPDWCDIENGTSEDNNGNGIPDECEGEVLTFHPTDDAYVDEYSPNATPGGLEWMVVRNTGDGPWECDALARFDVSSIPPGTTITSATYHLYYFQYRDNDPVNRPLTCYRITSDWDEETVSWNTRPTWLPPGQWTDSTPVPASFGWMEWDVTSDVQAFVNGTETNYGWCIMDETSWPGGNIPITDFRSKEHGQVIPYLEVVVVVGPCPGDIDGDGDTDHSDLGELLAAWCTQEGDPNWNPDADLDGDGHVGHGDLGILLADWGCGT